MSDKHLKVKNKQNYRLNLKYRCKDDVIIHVGLACFDTNRCNISPVQVSSIVFRSVELKNQLSPLKVCRIRIQLQKNKIQVYSTNGIKRDLLIKNALVSIFKEKLISPYLLKKCSFLKTIHIAKIYRLPSTKIFHKELSI